MSEAPSILPLRLENLVYAVGGKNLIDGISTEMKSGPRTLILGPNGAGKSLLLRLCHGLLEPTEGRVVWAGPAPGRARRRQAMVFQRPVVLRRSALANVEYALALRGIGRAERRERAAEALARTGLQKLADRSARVLSGGEQQRLALARAWALDPEVLFLDEPAASLDPAASRAIERIIAAIAESGTKIVMTTHDLGQARRLASEIIFLHHGHIAECAEAEAFFKQPKSAEADAFMRGELDW